MSPFPRIGDPYQKEKERLINDRLILAFRYGTPCSSDRDVPQMANAPVKNPIMTGE